MLKIVQATCTNGELVMSEKLSPELEGKTIQIVVLEPTQSTQTVNDGESKIHQFLEKVNNYSFLLPPEANQLIVNEIIVSSEQQPKPHPLDTFMERLGPWEDERTAEEIVKDIYDSRTISNNDISL